jgi:hypothetical protein
MTLRCLCGVCDASVLHDRTLGLGRGGGWSFHFQQLGERATDGDGARVTLVQLFNLVPPVQQPQLRQVRLRRRFSRLCGVVPGLGFTHPRGDQWGERYTRMPYRGNPHVHAVSAQRSTR